MSDDSFIREVNEELRQDRAKAIWSRFGKWLLAGAVLVILATIGFVVWERYRESAANASGDAYSAALDLAEEGRHDEAIAALQALAQDSFGAYPELARMRIATVHEASGDPAAAVAAYDAVAADGSAPEAIRDMAAVRAAYLLVDSGSLADVRQRVEVLSGDSEPLRHPAREALALAAWKVGETENARALFQQLLDDQATPSGIASRARLMLDVIAAGGTAAATAAAAPAEAPAAPAEAAPATEAAPVAPAAEPEAPEAEPAASATEPEAPEAAQQAPAAAEPAPAAPAAAAPASEAAPVEPAPAQQTPEVLAPAPAASPAAGAPEAAAEPAAQATPGAAAPTAPAASPAPAAAPAGDPAAPAAPAAPSEPAAEPAQN